MDKTNESMSEREPKRSSPAQLPSEEYTERALPPVLKTSSLVAVFILTIYFITNAATAASGGATAFVYWAIGGIIFFLPSVLATFQLGVLFLSDGSIYVWTHKALGPYWAFFANLCWWFPGPIIVVNATDTTITYVQGLHPSWFVSPWQQGLAILFVLTVTCILACQSTQRVLGLVDAAAVLILCATLLIMISAVIWILGGHAAATSFTHPADWAVSPKNLGLFGLVTIAYLGVQAPLNMGGEIVGDVVTKRKRIAHYLLWGSVLVVVCYFGSTAALLIVQGPINGANPFALIATVDQVLGPVCGSFTALCIIGSCIITATMYHMLFARQLFVAGIDKRLPISLARLNKSDVPQNAIVVQTIISSGFAILAFLIAPNFIIFDKPENLSNEVFNIGAGVVTIIWCFASMFPYICLLSFFVKDREAFRQQGVLSPLLLWATIVLGVVGCLITISDVFFYSWIPSLISNSNWSWIIGGLLGASCTFGLIFSMFATREVAWQRLKELGDEEDDAK